MTPSTDLESIHGTDLLELEKHDTEYVTIFIIILLQLQKRRHLMAISLNPQFISYGL